MYTQTTSTVMPSQALTPVKSRGRALGCLIITVLITVTIPGCKGCKGSGSDNSNLLLLALMGSKEWTHPVDLDDNISPDGQSASGPQVAMDNNGNAIVVWYQSDGIDYAIFKSEYRSGSWTHPTDTSNNISPEFQAARYPQVAMDDNGNAIIVWQQSDGSNEQIFKSEYRGGSWTHPTILTDHHISPDGQNASSPQVAMDNNGNALIVWQQSDGSNPQIFMSEYRGGSWTHPTSLTNHHISPDGQNASSPQVAMDNNGNALIVWQQSDGSNPQIFMSEYRNNGPWVHPGSLTDDHISLDSESAFSPRAAMDNNGNALIAWYQNDTLDHQIFISEYRNGTWNHPDNLDDNISPNGGSAYYPIPAMDDRGSSLIAWFQYDADNWQQIFMSEYRNGTWNNPDNLSNIINPSGAFDAYDPRVAMDGKGNAIIVWYQPSGPVADDQVFMSEYRSGSWTHPAGLTDNISPDGDSASSPQVAMDNDGNAIIVWQQFVGSNYQIFMSEYR